MRKLANPVAMAFWLVAAASLTSIISNVAEAAPDLTETARNPHNFTLKLDQYNFINGGWSGDAEFTISACPKAACFHLSGPIKIVSSPESEVTDEEGFFRVPGLPCDLHFEQMTYRGMGSGDYRLTLIGKDQGGKGCASLPVGLTGVYKQVIRERPAGVAAIAPANPALEVGRKLDMTSFPNSIGPRRTPGSKTLADYGFTQPQPGASGVDFYEADHSWAIGITVLKEQGPLKLICVTDRAMNGGSYNTSTPVEVRSGADGLLHATGNHVPDTRCPERPPFEEDR